MKLADIDEIIEAAREGPHYRARNLSSILGYGWSEFRQQVLRESIFLYEINGEAPSGHFLYPNEEDCYLSRAACYLVLLTAEAMTPQGIHAPTCRRFRASNALQHDHGQGA